MRQTFRALTVTLLLAVSLAPSAEASSYRSSARFGTYLKGASRSYDGNNISIKLTGVSCSSCNDKVVTLYYVALWRNVNNGFDNRIGTQTCSSKANCTKSWTNVGSGKYYFVFERANDGGEQIISTVAMYNS
jgi:hypothetical protein